MKVRISEFDKLNKKQREAIDEYIKTRGIEVYQNEAEGDFRRYYKLLAVALNEKFGFGKKRIQEVFEAISEVGKQREHDEVFWAHVDKVVIDQIGIEFERENYDDLDE